MSEEATKMLTFILGAISSMKYGYRENVVGAYQSAILRYGYKEPTEGQDFIVDKAIELLREE